MHTLGNRNPNTKYGKLNSFKSYQEHIEMLQGADLYTCDINALFEEDKGFQHSVWSSRKTKTKVGHVSQGCDKIVDKTLGYSVSYRRHAIPDNQWGHWYLRNTIFEYFPKLDRF